MPRPKAIREHLSEIMSDGLWRTPTELQRALAARGVYTTAHLEKMRDLRKRRFGGHVVEVRPKVDRAPGSQACEYRLRPAVVVPIRGEQLALGVNGLATEGTEGTENDWRRRA